MRTRLLLASVALFPIAARAQVSVVDEGSFTVTRDGRTGREDFRIVRAPNGSLVSIVASGVTTLGSSRTTTLLRTDTMGTPLGYQLEGRESGEVRDRINLQVGVDRLSIRAQTVRGESARELFRRARMLVLDEAAVHQYFLIALVGEGGARPVVLPRANAVAEMSVSSRGDEPIEIAGSQLIARHLVVTDARGERDVWVDQAGRVLRVEAPAIGLSAIRDAIPVER